MEPPFYITVTLNPAIDRTAEVDQLSPGKHLTIRTMNRSAGGKGINLARILAGEKNPCTVTGLLGKESFATFDSVFTREGIETLENLGVTDVVIGFRNVYEMEPDKSIEEKIAMLEWYAGEFIRD